MCIGLGNKEREKSGFYHSTQYFQLGVILLPPHCPPKHLVMPADIFFYIFMTLIELLVCKVEGRDTAKLSTTHSTALTTEKNTVHNVNSVQAYKPCPTPNDIFTKCVIAINATVDSTKSS